MELDIDSIEKNYARISDDKLIRMATREAHGLPPEVIRIIEKEIKKRKLNPELMNGAKALNKEYSIEEIEESAELLRALPCPICGSTAQKLNGTILHTVKSYVLIITYKKVPLIACPDCLDKKNNNAMLTTALWGWWSISMNLIKTPLYIYYNYEEKQTNRLKKANGTLMSFTLSHIGEIEAYKNDPKQLRNVIRPKARDENEEMGKLMVH